jgi:predicted hydrolase (HD superfamily)
VAEELIDAAAELAALILEENPQRLNHSAAVTARARVLAITVAPSAVDTLVAAAWLHDIGYGSRARQSGFHPLDGAVFLRGEGWPAGVCALVAHHSGSRFVARVLGLDDRLGEFEFVEDPLSDALTVADNTAGPNGAIMAVDERLREKLRRHGPDSPNVRANPERDDYIRAADRRVARRLAILDRPDGNLGDVDEQPGDRR